MSSSKEELERHQKIKELKSILENKKNPQEKREDLMNFIGDNITKPILEDLVDRATEELENLRNTQLPPNLSTPEFFKDYNAKVRLAAFHKISDIKDIDRKIDRLHSFIKQEEVILSKLNHPTTRSGVLDEAQTLLEDSQALKKHHNKGKRHQSYDTDARLEKVKSITENEDKKVVETELTEFIKEEQFLLYRLQPPQQHSRALDYANSQLQSLRNRDSGPGVPDDWQGKGFF